jgi:glycosyltransferase involved in cell wall biosynthesis
MRVAIYHNLPPGGALRALWEFVRRSSSDNEYSLYSVDMGRADVFAYARNRAEQQDLGPFVARDIRRPLLGGLAGRVPMGKLQPLDAVRRMRLIERKVAEAINVGGYDVAYVHPCALTHTPSVLRWLTVPSLHYMQEPRRRSFESGYRMATRLTGLGAVPRWTATEVMEAVLRRHDRVAASSADRIACNSQYSAESIARAYGRDADVCYLGVDDEVFTTAAHEQALQRRREAVSVGAIDRVKGQDLVVRALAALPAAERPLLNLVYERCDDRYRREVEALAGALGVSLRLHHGIADRDLAALYRSSSVTVLSARLEPFGLVALESLACGTPVVALREAGYRETVDDGVNGYLVERSPTAMAEAVQRVLDGQLATSPQALRGTVVARWSWTASVKRQLELLEATAEQGRG